jgi:hypothetical protein
LIVKVITTKGSRKLETEAKSLRDDVITLKAAIEEAIMKGQKSMAGPSDAPRSGLLLDEDLASEYGNASPGIVGWVDAL